jgi:hypothetical protein
MGGAQQQADAANTQGPLGPAEYPFANTYNPTKLN